MTLLGHEQILLKHVLKSIDVEFTHITASEHAMLASQLGTWYGIR